MSSDVGIILVTGKDDQVDRIVGLESGADDYVTKPFDPRELLSRVKNLLWRVQAQEKQKEKGFKRKFEGWTLESFLAGMSDEYEIVIDGSSEIELSLRDLPRRPVIWVLAPRYLKDS